MNSSNVHKCPKCKNFIFGNYCCNCDDSLENLNKNNPNSIFDDFFGDQNPFK